MLTTGEEADDVVIDHPLTELEALDEAETAKERAQAHAATLALAILEHLPDALVATDRAGVIVMVNQRAETMFGYHRSEILGRPVECLMPQRLRAVHAAHRAGFNRFGVASSARAMGTGLRLTALDRSGGEFPTEIMLAQLIVPDGLLDIALVRHSQAPHHNE